MKTKLFILSIISASYLTGCMKDDDDPVTMVNNPESAEKVSVDRFSSTAAMLFVRNSENNFPGANQPVDFDNIPAFITNGLGPNGEKIQYYNFDVQSTTPAPIYVLMRTGETSPVTGQLNIIDVIPGDPGYNDFWIVNMVTVPADYEANTVTSLEEIIQNGYSISSTNTIVNCPVVPEGSVARKRFSSSESMELTLGWYKDKVVHYFNFSEKMLMAVSGKVPTADIFVSFNINPDQPGGGPPSGFKTENGMPTGQAHNVTEALPTDAEYSPLWDVQIYDNNSFNDVANLMTARTVQILAMDAALVNCPIVSIQQ